MGLAVVTVAAGGLPVVEGTYGTPVSEAANGRGVPVTKVVGKAGLPVTFETIGVITAPSFTAWNPADIRNVTLSNSNLTATTNNSTGPGVRGVIGAGTGKYYWEATMTTWAGTSTGIGLGTSSAVFGIPNVAGYAVVTRSLGGFNGSIHINGSYSGSGLGPRASGNIIGIAVDLSARLIWFRGSAAGSWNGSATANPATGTEGLSIAALSGSLFPIYCAASVGEVVTANFGASAFNGVVPSGFTAGWPA